MVNIRANIKGLSERYGSWHLRRMIKGNLINKTLGRVDIMQQEEADKIAIDLLNGKSLYSATASLKTVQEVVDDLIMSPTGRGWKESYRNMVAQTCKTKLLGFMPKSIAILQKHEVRDWYNKGSNSPTSADSAFRILHRVLEYAILLELVDSNPCSLVSKTGRFKKNKKTGHIASDNSDIGKFAWALVQYEAPQLKANYQTARDVILLLLITGLRSDEARSLEWSNINMKRKEITCKNTKNRRDHVVPMTRLMYAMFKSRYQNRHDLNKLLLKGDAALKYVFPNRLGSGYLVDLRKTMKGLCKEAGLERMTLHDLRRTLITASNYLDVDALTIKKMVNHHTDVTGDYLQVSNKALLKNFEKVSTHISLSMPVSINGEEMGFGAGEPDNLMHLLYGDIENVYFKPVSGINHDNYGGI